MRNKKQKGTTKKVNEKQRTINLKITQVKALKDKVEEIFTSSVDIIDAASIKNLKILLTQYMQTGEDSLKKLLDSEIAKIIEETEQKKKTMLNSNANKD